jgi:hypothetical protein
MIRSRISRFALLICALALVSAAWGAPLSRVKRPGPGGNEIADPNAKGFAAVIVNGRKLTGPNSSALRRDGRLMVPLAAIARSLGDAIATDPSNKSISVRRQTGSTAGFDARLGQVRENGSLVLTVSNAGDIIFSPNAEELMLPAEIVAALLDVSIRYDSDRNAVIISRGEGAQPTAASTRDQRPFDLYQLDYEYDLDRYSGGSQQSLVLRGAGRLADGRFTFLSNSTAQSLSTVALRTGTFNFERPNGQRFMAGDIGTGTNLEFLSATLRGASVSAPVGGAVVTAFGGRSYSGILFPGADPLLQPIQAIQAQPVAAVQPLVRNAFNFDTNIFGFYASTETAARRTGTNPFSFSGGAMRFSGAGRSGDLVSGSVDYDTSRLQLQGEFGYGRFAGQRADQASFNGYGAAVDLSGTFRLTDDLAVQGRYTNIGENFLSPQSGLREPVALKAGGVTWSPGKWFSASVNASDARRPGVDTQNNRYVTAAFAITPPLNRLPRFYFSHTQSSTGLLRSAAFTMLTASKDFSRWRIFLNATRTQMLGPAALGAQLGAAFTINDKNSFEVSQGAGSFGALNGQFDWHTTGLLKNRLTFSAGGGYNYSKSPGYTAFERFSASVVLPRQTSLQLNYVQTNAGPTLLVSLRGTLFHKREGQVFLDSPVTEMNSFGKVSGRVYQDVDLNGRFDPGVDLPQAEVKVRVDGNRYVVSDANGIYNFDSVSAGDHRVYLDLLSVRADLTFLDADARTATIAAGRGSTFDFRLVRTGRISGRVWLDTNENGKFDEGETPLADVRVTTASGRDTLTDIDGSFSLGDLPPGDHIILLDEKTLPEKTMAELKPRSATALPGRETSDILLPVIAIPAEVKHFGNAK